MKNLKFALAAIVFSAFTMNAQQDADVVAAKKAKSEVSQSVDAKSATLQEAKQTTENAATRRTKANVASDAKAATEVKVQELSADQKAVLEMEKAKAKKAAEEKIENN